MVRQKKPMVESPMPQIDPDAGVIDSLLDHLPALKPEIAPNGANAPVPQPPDIHAVAERLGIAVRRGMGDPDFTGVAIPEFYSEREARLAIARSVARAAVDKVGSQCRIEEGTHLCPSDEICEFVETAKSDDRVIDSIAAAVLMPTHDFIKWKNLLGPQEGPLSDSYGVPKEFARLRLRTIESREKTIES